METEGIACAKKEELRVTGAVTNSLCHILWEEVLREVGGWEVRWQQLGVVMTIIDQRGQRGLMRGFKEGRAGCETS